MIKFETINGTLCRMVEPEPLQLDSTMPCVVRYIQDCSPMGRYMKRKYAMVINTVAIVSRIGTDGRAYSSDEIFVEEVEVLEVIGYPVEEGSKDWALYQMMQGHEVCNPDIHGGAERFAVRDGRIMHHVCNAFEDYYCAVDSQFFPPAGLSTGWQIYKEPKPKYKIGDWVEWCGDQYMVESAPPQSGGRYDIRSPYDELGCSVYPENITRKLSPSEVIVHIGCMSGTVLFADADRFILRGIGNSEMSNACIMFKMLDTHTRELVERLLKAQEEETK